MCHRGDYHSNGDWEHRLVLETGSQGEEDVRYGPFVTIANNMAGPRVCQLSLDIYEADNLASASTTSQARSSV